MKSDLNQCLQFNNDLKLIPSIPDRAAYREAILRGNIDEYKDSCQVKAMAILKRNLENLLEMEFKEFEPWFKSTKTGFKLSASLNLETFDTNLSGTYHI